ncbi:hypothetical protein LL912_16110 [Niabella sp. CC-SYL272]|uniref:hypothetical protein n=1 Tax=Niabella agricola TaxID=2891571 RepID=UPI001F3C3B32|nr:hypothetical protein [Niabella agricola]MCF3110309.1 hypothetical protein [Niabella agricola]
MRIILYCLSAIAIAGSCNKKKDPPVPELPDATIQYTDLHNRTVAFGQKGSVDADANGTEDLAFRTALVGDPINKEDKQQWRVQVYSTTRLPVNTDDRIPVMSPKQQVSVQDFNGYHWAEGVAALLTERVTNENDQVFWRGDWTTADHRFIPFRITRNGRTYAGWVEVSFNKNQEQLILHRAALSLKENQAIETGS